MKEWTEIVAVKKIVRKSKKFAKPVFNVNLNSHFLDNSSSSHDEFTEKKGTLGLFDVVALVGVDVVAAACVVVVATTAAAANCNFGYGCFCFSCCCIVGYCKSWVCTR